MFCSECCLPTGFMKMSKGFTKTYACPCPAQQHAIDLTVSEWRFLSQMIEQQGEMIPIKVMDNDNKRFREWIVPRIYIAKHGIKAKELPTLGFEEVVPKQQGIN